MAKNWEEYLKENIDSQRIPQWKQFIAEHIPPARAGEFDPLAGENGMFNLPETMETMSARRSPAPVPVDGGFDPLVSEAGEGLVVPFVDAIAQAAMRNEPQAVRPTRRVNAMDAITTAADTGFEDFTPEQINTPVNMPALVQDAAATALAIPYTAASTGVSTANFLTGGMLDDAVLAMNEGERALRQSFGSDELNRQVEAVNAVQQDVESNLFDVLVAAANNPRSLAYDAIRNFGTMALPTGAALGAGKLAQAAPALARYVPALERVAPWMANNAGKIGAGASMTANALMNASDTFSDEEMMKQSLGERYAGSGISGLISLLTGVATEGGAEGQIARRLLNGRQEAASGALNYLKGLGKSAFKEGLQEYGEESGNYLGKVFGTNGLADFNEMNKQAGYSSVLGTLTGSGSHVVTNLGGQRQQTAEPLSAIEQEMDRRMAVDALRPENAQRVVPNMSNTPGQNERIDFLSQVMTELEKIRQQNEQQVQARQVQGQRVEPQDVRWNEMPQQEQPAVQASQEAQVSQGSQRGKDETLESLDGQRPADNMPDNPLDIIIANGGIRPDVLKKDLGWTDEEIAKLPQGVVTDDGKTLLPLRRALKKAGLDTDVNAILDAASRPEAPEMDFAQEEAQLLAQQNGQPVADTRQEKADSPEKMSNRLFEPESVVRQPAEEIKSVNPGNTAATVTKEENVQPGKDKKQDAKNINPVPQQYFTAKDGSFVAFIDHSGNKPMMTAIGRNGQTKGIVVGKTVSQMVQDGRLIRSSREDIGKWLNDKGLEWPSENVLPQSDSVGAEPKNEPKIQPEKQSSEVRGNLPTGGTEYLTGAVPEQQTSQLAKEGQPDAAENNVSRSGVKGQEETDPPRERAQSSHSVAGTPRAVSGQSGNETSVNETPSADNTEPRNGTRQEQMALFSRKRNESKVFTESDSTTAEERAEADRQYDEIEKKYKGTPLWMKAPNGQPTKLTERQWVQVRTLNFKRWFGDWEKAGIRERLENQEPVAVEKYYSIENDRERRSIAASLIEKQFTVEKSIGTVSVSRTSMRNSFSHGTSDEKLDVVRNIRELLEKAELLDVARDFDGKDVQNYYLATKIRHGGETKFVFFRARERRAGSKQLYVHDVFVEDDIKQKAGTRQTSGGVTGNAVNARGSDLYKSILQDIYAVDNESVSKVVDSNGEPTASDVKAFTDDPKSEPVKYSRKEQQDRGMSVDELILLADTLVESFHNAPGIVVADRPQDAIPNALPDGMGLFDPNNGKVFLFARNIRDADTARAVFAHEVIAHYGLRGFFGDSLGDVLVSIRNHNPKIEKLSQEWWSENQDYIKQVRENEGRNWTEEQFEKWQRDISIEEAMAFFAEQGERITGVKRLVRKIQELLRDITRRLGWRWPANLANWLESKTDAEALSALHQAGLFVRGEISGQTTTTQSDIEKYRVSDDGSFNPDVRSEGVDVPAFSKSSPRQGVALDEVRRIADDLAREYKNAPELVVVEKASDLPFDAPEDAKGAYRNGRCYLVSGNIATAEDAKSTFAHEVIGHYGLNGFFGDRLASELDSILVHNENVQQSARKWIKDNLDLIRDVREKTNGKWTDEQFRLWRKRRAIEEALADMAEKGQKVTGVKKLVYAIQKLLRAIGLGNLANRLESRTDAEALMALHKAELFVRSGKNIDAATTTDVFASFSRSGKQEGTSSKSEDARKTFEASDVTLGDVFVRSVQDDNIDLKRVQDDILEQGGIVTDRTDAYMAEEEYLSKTKAKLDRFSEEHAIPILEKIRASGVSLDEAGRYIHARHVMLDRVNAKLSAINPGNTSDRLSGMSNREAREILDRNKGNTALQELGKMMDDLARYTRSVMLNGGLITRETYDHWGNTYQHYVPLYRDLDGTRKQSVWERLKEADYKPWNIRETGQGPRDGGKRGRGFEVRGEESKRRMGSDLDVTNVIVNAVAQAEGAIIRAEKAKVALALLDLAKANPNEALWRVDEPVLTKQINPETGLVEYVSRNPNTKPADNVLVVKENGRERWIVFNEKNRRAMAIAEKFRNLDAAAMNWVVEGIGDMTRWMAGWLTQKNPIFMFFNFQRDFQHAVFNMSDTPIAGKEGQFLKYIPLAMKGYWQITFGENRDMADNTYANYAREFREAGAETGFIKSFESINDRITDVEKQLAAMSRGKGDPRAWMAIAGRAVDGCNSVVENGVRLAAYITARENGMNIPRAAQLAKNITVNFNKRGTSGRWLNALYMFANANIQGNARMLKALAKSKRARIYAGFMVGIGFMMDMVCSAVLGTDDETGLPIWDGISEFDKERNWIIPMPKALVKDRYIKIPMPQGLHILPNVGRMLSELVRTGGQKNVLESATRIALMTADTLSPLGSSGSWLQMAFPSVLRPLVQITENKSFTGSTLYRGDAPFGGYNAPAYAKAYRNTPEHWVNASRMLNFATGGDDVKSGMVNVPPEALRLAVTSYVMPGVSSQLIDRAFDVLTKKGEGKEIQLRDLPIVSRMIGEMPDEREKERAVYDRLSDLRDDINVIKEYKKQGRLKEAREGVKELGNGDFENGLRIFKGYDAFTNRLQEINRAKRIAEKKNNEVALKNIETARKRLFAEFLRRKM